MPSAFPLQTAHFLKKSSKKHEGYFFNFILVCFLLHEISRKFTYFMNFSVTHLNYHVYGKRKGN